MFVGKCFCGTVRDAVDGPFLHAGYCHCSRCRAASGSAFSAFAGVEKLRVTDGKDSINVFERGSGQQPVPALRLPLFVLERDGRFFHVRIGTLLDDPGIRPMFHVFIGSKALWYEITDALPQYAELPS
jgi:hypothetical protein